MVLTKIFCAVGIAVGIAVAALACIAGGWGVLCAVAAFTVAAFLLAMLLKKLPAPKSWLAIVILLALTLIPRIAAILMFPVKVGPPHDFTSYFIMAESFVGLRGYVENSANLFPHGLFFSLALSVPFRLFGASIITYQIVGLVLSCVTAVLLYLTARLIRGEKAGLFAAAAFALCPAAVLYAPLNCSEHLALALAALLAYLTAWVVSRPPKKLWSALIWGAGLGAVLLALQLIRPVAIIFVIALALMALTLVKKPPAASFVRPAAMLLALLAVLYGGKEAAYAAAEGLRAEPLSKSSSAFTLLVGSNAKYDGGWNSEDSALFLGKLRATYDSGYDYASAYAEINHITLSRYRELGVAGTVRLLMVKASRVWGAQSVVLQYMTLFSQGENSLLSGRSLSLMRFACDGYSAALLLMVAVACARRIKKGRGGAELFYLLGFLGLVCLYSLTEAAGRYSLMALPLLAAFIPGVFFANFSLDNRQM